MSERGPVRGVPREVREAARSLRRERTPAEVRLWKAIGGGRLGGLKFRGQHAVGRFVLDFYCPAHRLVVELDGAIHDLQVERDEARTAELEVHGYRVLRFRNEEVLNQLPAVLRRIRDVATRPWPPLPALGEGGGSQAARVRPAEAP